MKGNVTELAQSNPAKYTFTQGLMCTKICKTIELKQYRNSVLDFNILSCMHNWEFFLRMGYITQKITCTGKILHAQSIFYMHLCMSNPLKWSTAVTKIPIIFI